jgi:CheY-like chemotaxis protein
MEHVFSQRVAVLDDDVRFIRMVERMLNHAGIGMQPVTTPDLDDAAGVVASAGCSAALVDVYMYGAAFGFSLIERLRGQPATRDLPIIVTSGAHREIGRRVRFLLDNDCAVLLKPFTGEELLGHLRGAPRVDAAAGASAGSGPERHWLPALRPMHVQR